MQTNTKKSVPPHRRRRLSIINLGGMILFAGLLVLLVAVAIKGANINVDVTQPPDVSDDPGVTPSNTPNSSLPGFSPYALASTEPSKLINSTLIMANGLTRNSYEALEPIDFGLGKDYTDAQGIVSFRGNNFRDGGSYGVLDFIPGKLSRIEKIETGVLTAPDGTEWQGSGWVGQPLVMTWPKAMRAAMNLYGWAKEQTELTEVIYATQDGNVYFFELGTGKATRETLGLGYVFKGAGAVDPRGYPILYLGSGCDSARGVSHAFIISLIDGSILYEFGGDDYFSLRREQSSFSGSPLVDAETDTLIYPGENGVLYLIKLNTEYDENSGSLSINPSDIVKWRYSGIRSSDDRYWLGAKGSCVIWRGCAIIADGGGHLMCLDLNTLTVKWAQDVLDDTVCSPVLELEGDHPYIYISTSFQKGWRDDSIAQVPIWKIDAVTGRVVWCNKDYDCYTMEDIPGGVLGTIAVGKNKLSDLIFVPVARPAILDGPYGGFLAALDKADGHEVWRMENSGYSLSSPVVVYDKDGNGYIIHCTVEGYIYLIDGRTGDKLAANKFDNIEASPVVYNDVIVIGTRTEGIWLMRIDPK